MPFATYALPAELSASREERMTKMSPGVFAASKK